MTDDNKTPEADDLRERVEKVVSGPVTKRDTPVGKKLKETFIGGDTRSVWSYVALDVLVPAAKDMVADAVREAIDRLLYGEAQPRSRRNQRATGPGSASHVSYSSMSTRHPAGRAGGPDARISRRGRATHDFGEFILATRVEAQEALTRMFELLDRYKSVRVSDLYDLLGETSNFTDESWGWTDLSGSDVRSVRGGYMLNLPRPEPIRD